MIPWDHANHVTLLFGLVNAVWSCVYSHFPHFSQLALRATPFLFLVKPFSYCSRIVFAMSVHFHGGPSRNADQPAGDDSSFCGLCGVILKTVSRRRVNAQARKKQRLEWLEEIRGGKFSHPSPFFSFLILIYCSQVYNAPGNPSNVLLSGIGFVINNHIEAHVNSALTYQDRGPRITNTLRNVSLHGNSWGARCWTYAVHESCWQLLLAKLQQQGVDSEDMIATALHGILLTTEYPQGSQFQLGHDYGGAPGSSNPDHLLDIFRSDPWKIPGVAHLMNRSSLAVPSLPSTNRTQPAARVRPTTTDKDVFASLSPELICMVMSQLSISEIGHLREASRAIASLISKADDLPQNCWKSQFGPGKEMVCVFINLQPPANLDWRKLYLLIKRGFSGIAALENRQRIWSLLENVTHLVKLALDSTRNKEGIEMSRMKHDTYSATNPALDPNSYLEFEPIKTSWISAEWWGKDKYGGHRDELTTGCRELDLRAAYTTPAPDFAGLYPQRWSAGVSLVEVHSRSYISGIRFFAPDAGKGHSPRSCLGFVSPDEVEIQFEPHEFIEGVEVAVCNTGIVGIKFLTSGASAHGWTGCTDLPDTAFGRLLPQEGKCIAALIAGLDVKYPPF